jgi:RNA polymerase sigma-70 factor (ECF subfamily)
MRHAQRTVDAEADMVVPDAPTFERFFQDQHRRLHAAMFLITRDRQEAEEIMQDAFLRLWERWDRVGSLDDPEGYLYRTAMNVFRSRRRRATVSVRRVARPAEADDLLESIERREVLVQALASLTPRERAAVVMTDVLGFTSKEAADALGIASSTVRVLAARGRGRLQQEVTDDDA